MSVMRSVISRPLMSGDKLRALGLLMLTGIETPESREEW